MLSRRGFIKLTSVATGGLLVSGCQGKRFKSLASAHVVIIGGGFGGATAAKYLRKLDPNIKITLIEANTKYTSCPGSNWVLGGLKNIDSLSITYKALSDKYAVQIIHDRVKSIYPEKHVITLSNHQTIRYDRLIVSPGIDFRWNAIEGHNESTTNLIPHAWKAGAQTRLLQNQLKAMRDGGTVIICAPPNPFRCPPGPYERASMIAHYLKKNKPKSKVLILDSKNQFSKQALFFQLWERHYGFGSQNSMIEWLAMPDNPVIKMDVKNKRLETDFGDKFNADVINYIPTQKAGEIAQKSGLCDESGWCPVFHKSSESKMFADIHVIGDASIYAPIPKSAFAANSEAKVCTSAVISLLNGFDLAESTWGNACYSMVSAEHAVSIAMVYKLDSNDEVVKVKGAGGVTQRTDDRSLSLEAEYAKMWLRSITEDSFG
jgi:sulfide dehydrogenase [flavocytochrome c] flavoprotein subunit